MRRLRLPVVVSAAALALAATIAVPAGGASPQPVPTRPHRPTGINTATVHAKERPAHRIGRTTRTASRLAPGLQSAQHSALPVLVDVHGDVAKGVAAVRAAGGQVRGTATGALSATVPGDRLASLAAADGVNLVAQPVRPVEQAVSQGVALSGASTWQSASLDGTGVKVAIIDAGFAGLPFTPAAQTNYCAAPNADTHGAAVAEIVHDMAPKAQLYLYCVDTTVEVNTAEQAILKLGGVKVISSSLGWPGDSRGDGSGAASSVANAIHDARKHNILWVNSAGNEAQDHWSGTLTDATVPADGLVDLNGPTFNSTTDDEDDNVFVAPGGPAEAVLTWDQWPTSSLPVSLLLFGYQCSNANCDSITPLNASDGHGGLVPFEVDQAAGTEPFLAYDISNGSAQPQLWDIYVGTGSSQPSVHYDLSYDGDVSPSYLSTVNAARAAAGSVDPVAQSPYAMAVGAVDAVNGTCVDSTTKTVNNLFLEQYSSQGPTIDGRAKPDIAGYDGTVSDVFSGQPFCGTSAAAPHVAGAAALVAQENPTFNAAQLQTFLQKRANNGAPLGPANPNRNSLGFGVLTLGQTGTSGTCSISVPARVSIGAATTSITATAGSDCGAAGMAQAQWNIVPSNVGAGFTFNGTTSASYLFQSSQDTVGALQVQPGGASTLSLYGGIGQNSTAFAAKYATLVYSASSRSGSAVYVNGLVHQWSVHGSINPNGISVWLQRYIGGGWQTMLARTAATGHVSVGFVQTTVYQYRWVVLETATAWSGTSAVTIR